MTALAYTVRDSATMLRRDILHSLRYPLMTISGVTMPILFLLFFDGVFGNTLRAGLGSAVPAGGRYIDYLAPGILVLAACAAAQSTAINISTDMSEGIIARFRTMAISRTSVLTGQVLGSFVRTMISGVLVLALAIALGYRPHANIGNWLAAIGIFMLFTIAVTWLTVAFGLFAKTPAGASSLALLFVILPFVSSAYVPTDSMPAGVRWFAENQPFTSVIQTLRELLAGASPGRDAVFAIAWCIVIATVGYLWARARYERLAVR
jgi:ABC-2 type transport system permease protein